MRVDERFSCADGRGRRSRRRARPVRFRSIACPRPDNAGAAAAAASGRRAASRIDEAVAPGARAEPRSAGRAHQPADPGLPSAPGAHRLDPAFRRTSTATTRRSRRPSSRAATPARSTATAHVYNFGSSSRRRGAANYSVGWNNGARHDQQHLHELQPAARSQRQRQLHAAAAAQLQDRRHAPAAARQQKNREISDVAAAAVDCAHDAQRRNAYWDLVYRDRQPGRAAAVAELAQQSLKDNRAASRSARWRRSTSSRPRPKWRSARRA